MKVCGVELTGNDAVVCLLSIKDGIFDLPDCRVRKISIDKSNSQSSLRYFQASFAKLMSDYKVEMVIIRERPTKGKFAGSAQGFKLEAAIQLVANLQVELMTFAEIKELIKKNPLPVAYTDTGLKAFQEGAFLTAYAYLMKANYASELKN